jgi:DNA (cytosine-5)-methyltransferase 1
MGAGGNNQPHILQPQKIGTIGEDRQGYRVYNPENIGVAVKSHQGGIFANTEGYLINNRPRRLTPRECLRLQGFPETFNIVVSDTQIYKQIGNAVAVPVVGAIAKAIRRQ